MLLEFRLRNFRVFRDEAALSLIASTDKALIEQNTIPTGITAAPRMVRTAAVYGPNAGGKTTLRRDQIWFAEKNEAQAAELAPLAAFSPRKDEAFERGYLGGRYGGAPVLDSRLLPARRDAAR